MKYINRHLAVVTGIVFALAGAAVPARALTSISGCPANIPASGNYQLTADLGCTVTISASNVSLALNGHTITAPAASDGIHVNVGGTGRLNHVGIQGPGLIIENSASNSGISIVNTDYSQVALVTVKGGFYGGILGTGDTFLTVGSNVLAGGSIAGSGGAGVLIIACTSCTISGNDVSRNAGQGIFIGDGSANTVNNNTANGNNSGIFVFTEPGTRVSGNVTNGNIVGILVEGPGGVQVFSNTSSRANANSDLVDLTPGCTGNLWSNNVFQTANQSCIN